VCKVGPKPPRTTLVYGFTSRSILWREVVESVARRAVSISLGERRRIRFPSVLLQPLGHLSVYLDSTPCERSGKDYPTRRRFPLCFLRPLLGAGPALASARSHNAPREPALEEALVSGCQVHDHYNGTRDRSCRCAFSASSRARDTAPRRRCHPKTWSREPTVTASAFAETLRAISTVPAGSAELLSMGERRRRSLASIAVR
jgi:hypothetical protein